MVAIFPKCACPILWAPSSKPSFQILVLTLNCYVFQEPCNLKIVITNCYFLRFSHKSDATNLIIVLIDSDTYMTL